MMFDDQNFAVGEARAEIDLSGAFGTQSERTRRGDAFDFFRLDAGGFQRQGKGFVGKRSGPVLPRNFGLFDGSGEFAVFDDAAGGIAQQAAETHDDFGHVQTFRASQ